MKGRCLSPCFKQLQAGPKHTRQMFSDAEQQATGDCDFGGKWTVWGDSRVHPSSLPRRISLQEWRVSLSWVALSELRRQRSELQSTEEAGLRGTGYQRRKSSTKRQTPEVCMGTDREVCGWELSYTYTTQNPRGLAKVTRCRAETWTDTPEVLRPWETVDFWPKQTGRTF